MKNIKNETFYRPMRKENYEKLCMIGELPPTRETFVSPTASYCSGYHGVLVEFRLKRGAAEYLHGIAVSNNSQYVKHLYGNMPMVEKTG